jgi:hypothetical protein
VVAFSDINNFSYMAMILTPELTKAANTGTGPVAMSAFLLFHLIDTSLEKLL